MFSSSQQDFLNSFIPTLRQKGYQYYVAYTHTNTGSYNRSDPDLYIIASTDEIKAQSAYRYSIPSGSVRYTVRTNNYSTGNYAVNTERIVNDTYSGDLRIDVYEHIYTNSTFVGQTLQPDILGGEPYADTTYLQANNVLVGVVAFIIVFLYMWHCRK